MTEGIERWVVRGWSLVLLVALVVPAVNGLLAAPVNLKSNLSVVFFAVSLTLNLMMQFMHWK